jgi:hypothetical protein
VLTSIVQAKRHVKKAYKRLFLVFFCIFVFIVLEECVTLHDFCAEDEEKYAPYPVRHAARPLPWQLFAIHQGAEDHDSGIQV